MTKQLREIFKKLEPYKRLNQSKFTCIFFFLLFNSSFVTVKKNLNSATEPYVLETSGKAMTKIRLNQTQNTQGREHADLK